MLLGSEYSQCPWIFLFFYFLPQLHKVVNKWNFYLMQFFMYNFRSEFCVTGQRWQKETHAAHVFWTANICAGKDF